jgi:hypothetical protein
MLFVPFVALQPLSSEWPALPSQVGFEAGSAITVLTRPALLTIEVAAAASCVSILNFQEFEILFPIWTLLCEGSRAVTHLNPLNGAIIELPRFLHIPKVLVAGDGASAESAIFNRFVQRLFSAWLHFCGHKVAHAEIVLFCRKTED